MSYEAMPCVLKNEDGTPVYGLLIKPLQNQLVIQLAPNSDGQQDQSRQQQSQNGQPGASSTSSSGAQYGAYGSQGQNWSGAGRTAGSSTARRHYPTILPRETAPSTSKLQVTCGPSWLSSAGYTSFAGTTNNVAPKMQHAGGVKFGYTNGVTAVSTPAPVPLFYTNGQQKSPFAQVISSHGFLSSQRPVSTSSGTVNCQLVDQQLFNQNDVGTSVAGAETVGIAAPRECTSNSLDQCNSVASGQSTDFDSLLRDVDLNEITNSLMPLLQDCTAENGEGAFLDHVVNPSSSESSGKNANGLLDRPFGRDPDTGQSLPRDQASAATATSSASIRPPCRYQGLLSNTSNLRVGRAAMAGVNRPLFSALDARCPSAEQPESACAKAPFEVGPNKTSSERTAHGDADHTSNKSATPDSGIQSMGDSPHAAPHTSPMQFFSSSPCAGHGSLSSPGCKPPGSYSSRSEEPHQSTVPSRVPVQAGPSAEQSTGGRSEEGNGYWTGKYMQPLCVNTAYFEPVSECESSPAMQTVERAAKEQLDTPRCDSPSTTSSECGSSGRRKDFGSMLTKRKKRTKKRTTGQSQFEDMPILRPETGDANVAWRQCVLGAFAGMKVLPHGQAQGSKPDVEQLLNINDTEAVVEKLLSVVPREKLASLRRILDEKLKDQQNVNTSGSVDTDTNEAAAVPRWQSANAGYSSDTSDVSSFTETGLLAKRTPDRGDPILPLLGSCSESGSSLSPVQALRRSSAGGDPKKQDALKRLLEYRMKARSNCVKANRALRMEELLSAVARLSTADGLSGREANRTAMMTACKNMQEKLKALKDAPKLVMQEDKGGNRDARELAFSSFQNLETEASDDEESDVVCMSPIVSLSPCPLLTEEWAIPSTSQCRAEKDKTDGRSDEWDNNSIPDSSNGPPEGNVDVVQVKDNPQRKNISVKIKLSLLRNGQSEGSGKSKRQKSEPVLPPKKRFKDDDSVTETRGKYATRKEESSTNCSIEPVKKRRKSMTHSANRDNPTKRKAERKWSVATKPATIAQSDSSVDADDAVKLSVFRRCGACRTWIRVEDGAAGKPTCAHCHPTSAGKERVCSTAAGPEKVPLAVACQRSAKTGRSKEVVPEESTCSSKTTNISWKYPRKSYAKNGLLYRPMAPSLSTVFAVNQCRLLRGEQEIKDMSLPYDIWWHHRYQKNLMRTNPSENYRKLRSNVYVDAKLASGGQQHVCSCKAPTDESALGCAENCLNRLMYTECSSSSCPCGDKCTNNRFQRRDWVASLAVFDCKTEKGCGVRTKKPVKAGTFVCEYIGEVVSSKTFGDRMGTWYKDCKHHYALTLDAGSVIDAYRCGSVARFINHSCEPNCEMQKWWVNGHYRMGIFALRDIEADEELCYDYKFHAFNTPQACLCGKPSCRGFVDGSGGNHQTRKSTPRRSSISQNSSDVVTTQHQLLKPLSHRDRLAVIRGRLFLLRQVERMRDKLRALVSGIEEGSPAEEEKRTTDLILSQLRALKSRRKRSRHWATAEARVQDQTSAGLISLLKPILRSLITARGKALISLLADCKKSSQAKKRTQPNGAFPMQLDFETIERNLENGHYTTLEAFDKDVKCVLGRLKSNADGRSAAKRLERLYESKKAGISDQPNIPFSPPNGCDAIGEQEDESVTTEDFPDDLYCGKCEPFVQPDEDASAGLWLEKGDAFDRQDDKVHCVCGICEDDGMMIQCDRCRYWQHSECVGVAGEQIADEYVCEFCATGDVHLRRDVTMRPQPEIRLPHCVYYRSLMKRRLQVRIGECVYVRKNIDERHKQLLRNFNRECVQESAACSSSTPVDGAEEDRTEETPEADTDERTVYKRSALRVFRVERLFTGPRGVRFVFGSYFARPHETFCEPSRRFYRNEIFVTPLYDTLPLDAVVGRCLVLDVQTYCKGRPRYPKCAEEDIYICEYRLDKAQRLFDKMHSRNRYPICTKPYIFDRFPDRLKIKRDFTPFDKLNKVDAGHQPKAASYSSKSLPSTDYSKKTGSNTRKDSRQKRPASGSGIKEADRNRKKRRIESVIVKLTSA